MAVHRELSVVDRQGIFSRQKVVGQSVRIYGPESQCQVSGSLQLKCLVQHMLSKQRRHVVESKCE